MSVNSPEKILIRGVNWLGDAVMSMPAVQRLKERHPEVDIAILTAEKLADLWRMHPCVNDVIAFTPQENVFQIGRRLRWGNFSTGVAFPNSPRPALELWLGKIPRRVGYARPWRNIFLTKKVPARAAEIKMRKRSVSEIRRLTASQVEATLSVQRPMLNIQQLPSQHHAHQYLHLIASAFDANPEPVAPKLCVSEESVKSVRQKFQLAPTIKWLGINPGAEYGPAKRWPRENFEWIIREALAWSGWGVIFFGGKGDIPLTNEIATSIRAMTRGWNFEAPIINLAGQTSLWELAAALKSCSALVTNDTGPMHLAAAVGTPLVAIFGSTSPELTCPAPGNCRRLEILRSNPPCSPCFLRECPIDFRCMKELKPMEVTSAIARVTS